MSYFEVYNEEINDLLAAYSSNTDSFSKAQLSIAQQRKGRKLKIIFEDPQRGAVVGGLYELPLSQM
jgi:hypothetical protein